MDESPTVRLTRVDDYAFDVDFDIDVPTLRSDEPEPLGKGDGPNPTRMLLAAVGHCLSASLLFCLSKAHIDVGDVTTTATARLERNEKGRWRIEDLHVTIQHAADAETAKRMERCLALFEDFCVVTESVRRGIPVRVEVRTA
jgi:uncharacterized OsmC-like protein